MGFLNLPDKIQVTDGLVAAVMPSAWAFFSALAVMMFSVAGIRAALVSRESTMVLLVVRALLCLCVLTTYDYIFNSLVVISHSLTDYFASLAGYDQYWKQVADEFQPLFSENDDDQWDRLVGWARGGLLTSVVSVAYYVQFLAFDFVSTLTAAFACILRVLGPLLVAAGLIGEGGTLKQWFSSLVQVLLWPVVPAFLMFVTVGIGGNAIATGNVAFVISQCLILAILSCLSPLIVVFLMGRGGVTAFAGAVTTLTTGVAYAAGRAAIPYVAKRSGRAAAALAKVTAKGAGNAAEHLGHTFGDHLMMTRPGDALAQQMGADLSAGHARAAAQAGRRTAAAFANVKHLTSPRVDLGGPKERAAVIENGIKAIRAAPPDLAGLNRALDAPQNGFAPDVPARHGGPPPRGPAPIPVRSAVKRRCENAAAFANHKPDSSRQPVSAQPPPGLLARASATAEKGLLGAAKPDVAKSVVPHPPYPAAPTRHILARPINERRLGDLAPGQEKVPTPIHQQAQSRI